MQLGNFRPRNRKHFAAVAVDFIVHEPSGIIDVVSERSRDSSFLMYRNISVSVWCVLKAGWLRICEVRTANCGIRSGGSHKSTAARSRAVVPRKIELSHLMSRGVVVSSSETATARGPSGRKLHPTF